MSLIKSVSGVRGIVRSDDPRAMTLTGDVVRRLGRAYATYLRRSAGARDAMRLVGGRDGRAGGEVLLTNFAEGARASGVHVVDLGIVTTPGIAMMVRATGAAGGVVITASHNPDEWNGVKLMTPDGHAPTKGASDAIFDVFDRGDFANDDAAVSDEPVSIDPHEYHVAAVLATVDVKRIRRRTFKVVLDSVNGAGTAAGRMLLERLGCRVVHLNDQPAPRFAHMPEPTRENLVGLCACVAREGADVGFAQDPDADRVAIIDERGTYIGEEYSLALAAKRVFQTNPGPAAANLSTSRLIDDIAAAAGGPCRVYRSAVGEANVVEVMHANGCVIGGEGNGGVIDPRVVHVRDSLAGMALCLDLLAAEGDPLSRVTSALPSYAIVKSKIECDQARIPAALAAVREAFADGSINDVDGVRVDWPADRAWAHVRASNTEPIMRLIVEAPEACAAEKIAMRVRCAIRDYL